MGPGGVKCDCKCVETEIGLMVHSYKYCFISMSTATPLQVPLHHYESHFSSRSPASSLQVLLHLYKYRFITTSPTSVLGVPLHHYKSCFTSTSTASSVQHHFLSLLHPSSASLTTVAMASTGQCSGRLVTLVMVSDL